MKLSKLLTSFTSTTSPILGIFYSSVLWGKFMSSFAMSFFKVFSGKAFTSPQIFFSRYSFKMIGIDACSITTKMVDLQSFRNRAFYKLVSKSMGQISFRIHHEQAITSAPVGGFKYPAFLRGCLSAFGPELFKIIQHAHLCIMVPANCKGEA